MQSRGEEEVKQEEKLREFDSVKRLLIKPTEQDQALKFDWENKWLKGEEYYYILTHADLYIKTHNFGKYPLKTHPHTTYSNPISICKVISFRWQHVFR